MGLYGDLRLAQLAQRLRDPRSSLGQPLRPLGKHDVDSTATHSKSPDVPSPRVLGSECRSSSDAGSTCSGPVVNESTRELDALDSVEFAMPGVEQVYFASGVEQPYAGAMMAPEPLAAAGPMMAPCAIHPHSVLGRWTDSAGNAVSVVSTDAYAMNLLATLSNPPRPDKYLRLWQDEQDGTWHCGGAVLCGMDACISQLMWGFTNGSFSIWVRQQVDRQCLEEL